MAWQTPVTSWTSVPGITHEDFNRIEGNTVELKNAATIDLADVNGYFTVKNVSAALTQLKHKLLGV